MSTDPLSMRLRVGASRRLIYQDVTYYEGDEFEVPASSAPQWIHTGLVAPAEPMADAELLSLLSDQPATPTAKPAASALPAAKPGEYVAHEPCEPGAKPSGVKRPSLAVCPVAGCPCLTWNGECAECRRIHNRHRTRKREHKAYQRKPWKLTRSAYLREHPLCECEDCTLIAEPLRPAAQVVDHIDGLGPLGPRAHDQSNLRAMAKRCHDRRTMRDQVNGA
ncbi:HNH endonuclease signature motif containing protein [Streptomyces sp. NPDC079189]|uniref:HNH endonuclease signature motif containing protein n=1 Tax=Streptomyces sp. NPDC079189 TaxID=3154514 RepID=UPI0034386697